MLNDILAASPIAWILDKAQEERPYSDCDYVEYSFLGNLPSRMAQQIKSLLDSYYTKDSTYVVNEQTESSEKSLMIRFGNRKSSRNQVTFLYTIEKS